jgi:hypothetical protein
MSSLPRPHFAVLDDGPSEEVDLLLSGGVYMRGVIQEAISRGSVRVFLMQIDEEFPQNTSGIKFDRHRARSSV